MYGVTCRVTKMLDRFERRSVERLLSESGLVFEGTPDYTALAEDGDENVIATASLSGSVIKMVAASSEWRDAGLSGQVISALMNTARADGRHKFFIYTKPEAAPKFSALGFRELATSKNSVLMECGAHGMNEFRAALEAERAKNGPQAGAAVMNCNPFTLGHQFLNRGRRETVPALLRHSRRRGRFRLPVRGQARACARRDGAHTERPRADERQLRRLEGYFPYIFP